MKDAKADGKSYRLRMIAPQIVTGSRIIFGAAAMIAVSNGRLFAAAVLITTGAVTDILDGFLARRLGVASAFGALFDTFTDYLCFVVAPWAMCRALVGAEGSALYEALMGLPLLTGALRYARNSLIIAKQTETVRELPGLATVFFAFLPVVMVFLDGREIVGQSIFSGILILLTVVFSLLMVTSLRYPKLTSFRGASASVLVSLIVMPFVGTRILAGVMFIAGLVYVALGPFFTQRSDPSPQNK